MEQKSNAQSLWRVTGKLQGALIGRKSRLKITTSLISSVEVSCFAPVLKYKAAFIPFCTQLWREEIR